MAGNIPAGWDFTEPIIDTADGLYVSGLFVK
jgi:hypothetical protein